MSKVVFRVAKEFYEMTLQMTKAGYAHAKRCSEKGLCCGCERELVHGEQVRRGLCATCYTAVRTVIAKDPSKEADLLKSGRLLEKKPGGRPPANDFTRNLLHPKGV